MNCTGSFSRSSTFDVIRQLVRLPLMSHLLLFYWISRAVEVFCVSAFAVVLLSSNFAEGVSIKSKDAGSWNSLSGFFFFKQNELNVSLYFSCFHQWYCFFVVSLFYLGTFPATVLAKLSWFLIRISFLIFHSIFLLFLPTPPDDCRFLPVPCWVGLPDSCVCIIQTI